MKNFIIIICLFLSISIASAQEVGSIKIDDDETNWLNNRLGLYGSFMSGYGLCYQYQFDNGFSLKTQMFAYGTTDGDEFSSDEIRFSWGADLQYNLQKTRYTRLYALVGTFYEYYELGSANYFGPYDNGAGGVDIERYYNFGIGFGMEVILWKNATIAVEGGYYGNVGNNDNYYSRSIKDGEYDYYIKKSKPKSFGFGVGGGVFFAF